MRNRGNRVFYILLMLVICGLVYLLGPILTPFFMGILLAYLFDPLVVRLQRLHIPRILSIIIVFFTAVLIFVLLLLFTIPLLQQQITAAIESIPDMIAWTQDRMLPWLNQHFGVNNFTINVGTLKAMLSSHSTQAENIADTTVQFILHSGKAFVSTLINVFLVPVVAFYLLIDWSRLISGARGLLPRHIEPTVVSLTRQCDDVLSAFFRGQLIVVFFLCIMYSLGLTIVGLKFGIIIGLAAGLLSIVPYLGFSTGIIVASIAAYVQDGNLMLVWTVCLVFLVTHLIENMVLTPYFLGNKIGLHPVAVIFAVLAGGSLFGFIGVLLALPMAAVIMVWLRYLHKRYRNSQVYKAE